MIVLEHLFHLDVEVGSVLSLGPAAYGERRVVPITGGTMIGAGLTGEILPGGADWQLLRADGVLDIEARYVVKTSTGAHFEVLSQGYRYGPADVLEKMMRGDPVDPDSYYFRATMRFQTGDPDLAYLNRTLALAKGAREARWVRLDVERIC